MEDYTPLLLKEGGTERKASPSSPCMHTTTPSMVQITATIVIKAIVARSLRRLRCMASIPQASAIITITLIVTVAMAVTVTIMVVVTVTVTVTVIIILA